MPSMRALGLAFSISWTGFVAIFLYYVVLTLVTIGVGELSTLFIAVSYLAPSVVYLAVLVHRAVGSLVRMPVELWPTSEMILH